MYVPLYVLKPCMCISVLKLKMVSYLKLVQFSALCNTQVCIHLLNKVLNTYHKKQNILKAMVSKTRVSCMLLKLHVMHTVIIVTCVYNYCVLSTLRYQNNIM